MSLLQQVITKYEHEGFMCLFAAVLRKAAGKIFHITERFERMQKHKRIMRYLRENYGYVISKFTPPQSKPKHVSEFKGVIWSMWWQGEANCPDVIKLCLASIRKHCGSHRLIVITKDNYQDYITLPQHIISKVKLNNITLTHLSDIIRVNLLAKYGGLWMDSTLFAAGDIPEEIFSMELYTIKRVSKPNYSNSVISWSRWTSYCLSAPDSNSLLFAFMSELFSEYWKTHDTLIDYLLVDYVIAIAFEEFSEIYQAWNKIPVNNTCCWALSHGGFLKEEWDSEKYSRLIANNTFFKLTYKDNFTRETSLGKETTYGHLLSEYNI